MNSPWSFYEYVFSPKTLQAGTFRSSKVNGLPFLYVSGPALVILLLYSNHILVVCILCPFALFYFTFSNLFLAAIVYSNWYDFADVNTSCLCQTRNSQWTMSSSATGYFTPIPTKHHMVSSKSAFKIELFSFMENLVEKPWVLLQPFVHKSYKVWNLFVEFTHLYQLNVSFEITMIKIVSYKMHLMHWGWVQI